MKGNYVIFAVLLSVIIKVNSGVIDDVYSKARNTTRAIHEDINGWLSYGKDLVYGERTETKIEKRVDVPNNTIDTTEHDLNIEDGVFKEIYNKLHNRVIAVRKRIHDIILGQNNGRDNNRFVRNMYDRVRNRIAKTRVYILGEDNNKNQNESQVNEQDFSDKTKAIRESLNTFLFGHSIKNIGDSVSSGNNPLSQGTKSYMKVVENSADKGKDKIETSDKKIHEKVDPVMERLKGFLNAN